MSQTVSFVARDELAEWLEERAEREMKSVSGICQDIVAAEYRRENPVDAGKGGQTREDKDAQTGGDEDGESNEDNNADVEPLEEETHFHFDSKQEADGVRAEFPGYLSDNDDKRLKRVTMKEGTPGEVAEELERRSQD